MRKTVLGLVAAAMALALGSVPAWAIPVDEINGSISIAPLLVSKSSGTNTVLGVKGFNLTLTFTGIGTGDLSSFVVRPVAVINPYTFDPTTVRPNFLVFTDGFGRTATFDLLSSTVTGRNLAGGGGTVNVFSLGLLHLTGFIDTPASFNFAATKSGPSWSASATLVANGKHHEVPEPITLAMFGAGLLGAGALGRRRTRI